MHLPLCIFSDASLLWGNDLPKTLVKEAKEKGYSKTSLVDNDSMSAVVKYIQTSRSSDMSATVGSTITFHDEISENKYWKNKNKKKLAEFAESLGVSELHELLNLDFVSDFYSCAKLFKTCLASKPTIKKISNVIDKIELNNNIKLSVFPKDYSATQEQDLLNAVFSSLLSPYKDISTKRTYSEYHQWITILDEVDFERPLKKLMFFADSLVGYRNLMALVSMLAKKKHDNIVDKKSNVIALTVEDIELYGEGVVVVDPMTKYSLLGASAFEFESKVEMNKMFSETLKRFDNVINVLGVPFEGRDEVLELLESSNKINVPLPTAHYSDKKDYDSYCVKVAVQTDSKINDFTFIKPDKESYIHPYENVCDYYRSISKEKSFKIDFDFWENNLPDTPVPLGDVCLPNYDMPVKDVIEYAFLYEKKEKISFPDTATAEAAFDLWVKEELPEGKTFDAFRQKRLNDFCMHQITMEGLERRLKLQYGEKSEDYRQEYIERIEYEYKVIEGMGFSGYFLIEYDFVSYARSINVPVGPGRGSAAGSLIVYCMEITDVDPIPYGLQFERFLNPERVSMPDIDVDFGDSGENSNRGTVLKYISKKYQQEGTSFPSSSQISSISRYQLKSSISCVRKAYNLSMEYDGELKRLIKTAEQSLGISAPKVISWDELMTLDLVVKRTKKEPMLLKVLKMARTLSGKMSTFGVHAGGVVISPTTVTDHSAISCDDEGNYFSQSDKDDIESGGLIKFDVLGLKTLSVVSECVKQVFQNYNIKIDVRNIDFKDPEVFSLISQQVLADVFQLESGGMRDLVGNLQPQSIDELAVLSALYRPGALDSGMVEEYIDVKQGHKKAAYDHPALKTVTETTFGCIVYQEQVMSIVRELAGYSLGQADLIRRVMGKKKIEEMVNQRRTYSDKAMAFWREHYLDVGKKLGLKYSLDVNIKDLEVHFEKLGIKDSLSEDGYLADAEKVTNLFVDLLGLSEKDKKTLMSRMNDHHYVVMLFKEHYQVAIKNAVTEKLKDLDDDKVDEIYSRLYYALSQYIRFNQIFNKVEKFAGYGFNKSHAIAYSVVTYMIAYLKRYYPAELYSAALSFKELAKLHSTVLEASQKMGIKTLNPDINKSCVLFSVEDKKYVRYGFDKLKDMGKSAPSIVEERELNGAYLSVYDFLIRMKGYPRSPSISGFKSLAVTGAFDQFIPKRIGANKKINGRQFVTWLRSQITGTLSYLNSENRTSLHAFVDDMSPVEFAAYLVAVSPAKEIKKIAYSKDYFFKNEVDSIRKIKELILCRLAEMVKENENDILTPATVEYEALSYYSKLSLIDFHKKISSLVSFKEMSMVVKEGDSKEKLSKLSSWILEESRKQNTLGVADEDYGLSSCFLLELSKICDDELVLKLSQSENELVLSESSIAVNKDLASKLSLKVAGGKIEGIVTAAYATANTDRERFSILSSTLSKFSFNNDESEVSDTELRFFRACNILGKVEGASETWIEHLEQVLNQQVSDTLNEEREAAGFYMTSTPIKVLNIAERVEREPPGSIIDGCPVPVGNLDESCNEQTVTTYGIIRNVQLKSVKKETSDYYGEKILTFELEDGADLVNCSVFGTKKVKKLHEKVIVEGAVVMLAGLIKVDKYGLKLDPEVIKRYYPVEDPSFIFVSK